MWILEGTAEPTLHPTAKGALRRSGFREGSGGNRGCHPERPDPRSWLMVLGVLGTGHGQQGCGPRLLLLSSRF